MKRLAALIALLAIVVSGCGQNIAGNSSETNSGYSDSVPAKILETPDKAREAAEAANERVQQTEDAVEK